ncbi:MAG: hypothetical protein OEV00_14885, partial [Acidobacteriota bacterium]|nr:hypothetical protein [Acidobacteriota bacterium]
MIRIWTHLIASLVLALITFFLAHTSAMAGTEPLTFTELMKFKKIEGATLSRDGSWVAYTLKPDRGDGEAVARKVDDETEHRVAGCSAPQLSGDARWMACTVLPSQEERDTAAGKKKDDDKPRNGMALVSLADGTETHIDEVESFAFSDDGRWIAWKLYKSRDEEDEEQEEEETEKSDEEKEDDDRPVGTGLLLRDLSGDGTIEIPFVTAFSFDEPSRHLAYTTATPDGKENGIHVRQLGLDATPHRAIHTGDNVRISHPIWAEDSSLLGFLAAVDDEDHEPGPADLWVWDGDEPRRRAASEDAPDGWRIPSTNKLTWSRDGERLFFGYGTRKPEESEDESEEDDDPYDPYDNEALLEKRKVDVWHWDDPYIIPNQKKRWDKEEKDRVYLAVLHRGSGKVVRLADP